MPTPHLVIYESSDLESTIWRVVSEIPAQPHDFASYADLGVDRPTADYLSLAGVSHFLTLPQVRKAAKRWRLGDLYAELDLRRNGRIAFSVTNERTGHVSVWAPQAALLECVVNYAKEP